MIKDLVTAATLTIALTGYALAQEKRQALQPALSQWPLSQ